jgi:archaemetzincin
MPPREGAPAPATVIDVLRVGPVPEVLARGVIGRLSRSVSAPCRLLPPAAAIPLPELPHRPEQVDAGVLLQQLEAARLAGTHAWLVAITTADLALPVFTFVFGLARVGGSTCLVSLARLTQEFYGLPVDSEATYRRAADEALHELGHLSGLRHCPDYSCIMHFAATVDKADLRRSAFCSACLPQVPEILHPPPGR